MSMGIFSNSLITIEITSSVTYSEASGVKPRQATTMTYANLNDAVTELVRKVNSVNKRLEARNA